MPLSRKYRELEPGLAFIGRDRSMELPPLADTTVLLVDVGSTAHGTASLVESTTTNSASSWGGPIRCSVDPTRPVRRGEVSFDEWLSTVLRLDERLARSCKPIVYQGPDQYANRTMDSRDHQRV